MAKRMKFLKVETIRRRRDQLAQVDRDIYRKTREMEEALRKDRRELAARCPHANLEWGEVTTCADCGVPKFDWSD